MACHSYLGLLRLHPRPEIPEKTGYELIKSSANFAVDYLWKKPDGTYTAAPSTSPEHGPIDEGTTFSHAVIREILTDAIEASRILQTDEKNVTNGQTYCNI